jgi:hypothetical protein
MNDKPRHRSGYTAEDTELVRSACLTVAVTLGAYLGDLVVVGGMVPALLIDTARAAPSEELHPGTTDLDLGLSLAVLDEKRYAEISERLRAEGFEPDKNNAGNTTVQRWHRGGLKVDFLIPPAPGLVGGGRIHNLEPDFGAVVTPGLELAFTERVDVALDGTTLAGERASRVVPVCGPGAFVVLKTLAFADRGEPKDAFDLVYVLRHTSGGARTVAERLKEHAAVNPEVVERVVELLIRDFATIDHTGPRRAAEFEHLDAADRDNAAADAQGYVDDMLTAFRG